jgi:hypothetical protein
LDVLPKKKVKGYMYPQMKKPVGILTVVRAPIENVWDILKQYFLSRHG